MSIHVIEKQIAENKNMPKDFHIYLNLTIDYIGEQFGREAVIEYLEGFAQEFYAPELEKIKRDGLPALASLIKKAYADEAAPEYLSVSQSGNDILVDVKRCPAVEHINKCGYRASKYFPLTTSVVYNKIAKLSGLDFEMLSYSKTGAAKFRFVRGVPV